MGRRAFLLSCEFSPLITLSLSVSWEGGVLVKKLGTSKLLCSASTLPGCRGRGGEEERRRRVERRKKKKGEKPEC